MAGDSAVAADDVPTAAIEEQDDYVAEAWPWARFCARIFDYYLLSLVLGGALGLVAPAVTDQPIFSGRLGDYLLGLVTLPFALLIDALNQSVIGTTPGKAIAGIRVETLDHGMLSLGQAVRRNLLVYLRGFMLGLPILVLVGYSNGYQRVSNFQPTSWDEELGTRVYERGSNIIRTFITGVLVVGIVVGSLLAGETMKAKAPDMRAAEIQAALPMLNKGLPTFIDDVTRLDRVTYAAEQDEMLFSYTLVHRDASPVKDSEITGLDAIAPRLKATYCSPGMKAFRDTNLPVRHLYQRIDGRVEQDYRVAPADCP